MKQELKIYDITLGLFVAVLLISNITSTKIVEMGPFTFDGGTILFPVIYILGDIITEVYGFRRARRVIWTGAIALILMSTVIWVVGLIPSAKEWTQQGAYESILMAAPRIALASLAAYCVGEFLNSYILAKLKLWTKGRHLWVRTISSTIAGQLIDTVLFCMIAFYGVLPGTLLLTVMLSNYIFKVAYEVLATPMTYLAVRIYKRIEGIDMYDSDFKVFSLKKVT